MTKQGGRFQPAAIRSLAVLLSELSPATQQQRSVATVSAFTTGSVHPLAPLAFLPAAVEPLPCRLSSQQLVDLLRLPTCIVEARRPILDHLGNRYKRHFADQWDFVRFATQQKLGLDFTSVPVRPDAGR